MKITSTILFDFIADFKIVRDDVGICFDSIVNFNAGARHFNIRSEIFMESIIEKSIDSIYLLNPIARKYKIPTFFNDVNHQFLYLPYKALIIDGDMPLFGNYSISIFPKSRKASQVTLAELRAKKYN
ncbi:MAG: hypothetical protein ABIN94_15945 [Ferruginibacter sp.]